MREKNDLLRNLANTGVYQIHWYTIVTSSNLWCPTTDMDELLLRVSLPPVTPPQMFGLFYFFDIITMFFNTLVPFLLTFLKYWNISLHLCVYSTFYLTIFVQLSG